MGPNDPRHVANLDPRGLIGRIYVGDHLTLLHTIVCLFDLGLTSLSTFFSHIATVSGCGRELNAHF